MPPRKKAVAKQEPLPAKAETRSPSKALYILGLSLVGAAIAIFANQTSPHPDSAEITFSDNVPSEQTLQHHQPSTLVSIIMVAHNENHYLERTFASIMSNSPLENLLEIVFVDDASDPPASVVIDRMNNPRIRIVRNDERQGLIRAKTIGANAAKGDLFIYLDAHIRAYPGWMEPMLRLTADNYKRIVVPTIPVLNGTTWEQVDDYVGVKLIFDWKMDFIWYLDYTNDYVPIMSGGLLAITKKWFFESGEYDMGMLQWGGENVEQSVRTWLCGGEIVVATDSRVGHVFREVSPYAINTTQIHVNKARAIDVWFDEWASYYYRANPFDKDRRSSNESLAPRFAIKERLGCKPFSTFVEKFKDTFIQHELLPTSVFHLRDVTTGLCVSLHPTGDMKGIPCDEKDRSQVFIPDSWKRFRNGKYIDDCMELKTDGTVKAGLCSAHIIDQKWLVMTSSGEIKKFASEDLTGNHRCLFIDKESRNLSWGKCDTRFEKFFRAPYQHDLYK